MNQQIKKVLIISSKYPPEYAGSGLRAHRLYKRLESTYGVDYEVLAGSVTSNRVEEYKYEGVRVYRIAKKIFRKIKSTKGICSRIKRKLNYFNEGISTFIYLWKRKNDFDLFHTFGNNNITSTAITFAKIFDMPIVIEVTMDTTSIYQREPFPINVILKKLPRKAIIVCISERIKNKCMDLGYKEELLWCRPNPVEESKFFIDFENKFKFRHTRTRFNEEDILITYIAKFIPRKNQLFLVDVIKNLPPKYKLFLGGPIVGEGPLKERDMKYFEEINKKVKNNNLENRVEIRAEFIEDIDKYIKMADVYLFPPITEGLGTPMLESIACGIPVVANQIEGITDSWIKDGKNGYLSTLNEEEFAEKIKFAYDISKNDLKTSSEYIIKEFSAKVIDQKYYEIVCDITNEGKS